MIDVTNEIITRLKEEFPEDNVISSYQSSVSIFPTITVEEVDNSTYIATRDSSGDNHSSISFFITIYTVGNARVSQAKKIRNEIDEVMNGEYGFIRSNPTTIPNYLNDDVYRYRLSYYGVVDKNKKIYRR